MAAGDYIPIRNNISQDPRVLAMAINLKVDVDTIVGKLHRVWTIASENSVDGTLRMMSPQLFDSIIRLEGLAREMMSIGWLANDETRGLYCPNFDCWHESTSLKRAKEREKKRRQRQGKSVPGTKRGQVGTTKGQKRDHVPNTDTDTDIDNESISKPPLSPSGGSVRVSWQDGVWSGISGKQRTEWTSAYPSVNIESELAKATAWLRNNPDRAGKRNWSRFLNSWLARAHDRSPVRSAGQGAAPRARIGDGSYADEPIRLRNLLDDPGTTGAGDSRANAAFGA